MKQDRMDKQNDRASNMEKAEGSREAVRGRASSSDGRDRGTSSDRAMFSDRESSEPRGSGTSGERGRSSSGERGTGASGERGGLGQSSGMQSGTSDSGGISNRELSHEQSEQEELPDRGKRQSER